MNAFWNADFLTCTQRRYLTSLWYTKKPMFAPEKTDSIAINAVILTHIILSAC